MAKKWFQYNEVMAGQKRLFISYFLYKIFGEKILKIIAFFVSFSAFLISSDRKKASFEFYSTLKEFTGKKFNKNLSTLKQFLNYGNSLVDKMLSYSENINPDRFIFDNCAKKEIEDCIKEKRGVFFLTTHIGNAEILRTILKDKNNEKPPLINIFLEKKVCNIFNSFLDSINTNTSIETFALEEIGADTAIILDEKLKKGEFIFMAGDRIAKTNAEKFYKAKFLNKEIKLPEGAIRLCQMLDCDIFFIVCAKEKEKFNVHIQKFIRSNQKKEDIEKLKLEYSNFLQKYAVKYPYQFFHFYKIFE